MHVGHKKLCRHQMTGLEQVYLSWLVNKCTCHDRSTSVPVYLSPAWMCHGQSHTPRQHSWPVNSVWDGSLLHKSCFFLLCWHNRNYVPIWTHLNHFVNCELLIRTLIINDSKFCGFWKFVCFWKLWIFKFEQIQICTLLINSKSFNV